MESEAAQRHDHVAVADVPRFRVVSDHGAVVILSIHNGKRVQLRTEGSLAVLVVTNACVVKRLQQLHDVVLTAFAIESGGNAIILPLFVVGVKTFKSFAS
ncbi:hypothetical protein D3C84_1027950 [compost metagenome]